MEIDLLVLGRLIVTMDEGQPLIEHGAITIDAGRIVAIGPRAEVEPRFQARKVIDGGRKAVMPGLIDTHHHFLQNFHKGTHDDLSLLDWIDQVSVPRIKVAVQDFLEGSHGAQNPLVAVRVCGRDPGRHHHDPEYGMGDAPLCGRCVRAGRYPGSPHADHD